MTRKALKNIPMPDEEKLRALYSSAMAQNAERAPTESEKRSKQDYKSTSPPVYKHTKHNVHEYTSTQVHKYTSGRPAPSAAPPSPPPPSAALNAERLPPSHPYPQNSRDNLKVDSPYRRQTYHLRPDQIEWIRSEAFHTRRKISEVLRDIVDNHYGQERGY